MVDVATVVSSDVAEALFMALTSNGTEQELFATLLAWKARFPMDYASVKRNSPFARRLIEAIEEAHEYTGGR